MEIKGSAVKTIPIYVRERFGERYDEWLDSLSPEAQEVMGSVIPVNQWFPMEQAAVEPTQKICDLFFDGDPKGAWEAGRFSADFALKGFYKVFVKIGKPSFIISRSTRIFSTYYKPSLMEVVENTPKSGKVRIIKFPEPSLLIENRIGGWIERALEISGCKDLKVELTESLAKGDEQTTFVFTWS